MTHIHSLPLATTGAALLLFLASCTEPPASPPADQTRQTVAASAFGTLEDVPAVTMDLPPAPRPWDTDDAELVSVLEQEEGNAIVAFKLPTSPRASEAAGRRAALPAHAFEQGLEFIRQTGAEILYVYRSFGAAWVRMTPALAPELRRNPLVDYLEPQQWLELTGIPADRNAIARMLAASGGQTMPWGIAMVRSVEAWTVTTGGGVKVLIIDTGINPHDDLPSVPSENCGGAFGGCDGPPFHGTHVAGTFLARDNAIGVVGVAPGIVGSLVYGWGACDSEGCSASQIAAGIDWGRFVGVKVINMSLSGPFHQGIANSVATAWQVGGIVLVASAGNLQSTEDPHLVYPAALTDVIGVSGVRPDKSFAATSPCPDEVGGTGRSNWGTHVDLSAPFWALSTVGTNSYENETQGWCGNSMATPHVSGAAALVWAQNPSWTNYMVVNQLFSSAEDRGTWGRDDLFGYGIVDAAAAVGYQPPAPPFTVSIVGNTEIEANLSCQWYAAVSGGTAPYSYSWTVNGQPAGDDSSSLWYENNGSPFTIAVTVTDQAGGSAYADHDVAIVSGMYCE